MTYTELPLARVATGSPVPVNIRDSKGNLLLRKCQTIASEQHKALLGQGAVARNTLQTIDGVHRRAIGLLDADPDQALFVLMLDMVAGHHATDLPLA